MTYSEENYLKTIYHLTSVSDGTISTNAVAEKMKPRHPPLPTCLKNWPKKGW